MNKDELRKEFEIEYSHKESFGNIPFGELFNINEDLKNDLFEDFLKCERIPCARLYDRLYFSDSEYQKALEQSRLDAENRARQSDPFIDKTPTAAYSIPTSDIEKLLRSSRIEFEELRYQNKLPEIYFMHDLGKSSILNVLNKVQRIISDTQMYLSRATPEPNMLELVDSRCKEVISLLDTLNNIDLKKSVLESIINEDCSIFFSNDIKLSTIKSISGESIDYVKWNIAKDRINKTLRDDIQHETQADTSETQKKAKTFRIETVDEINLKKWFKAEYLQNLLSGGNNYFGVLCNYLKGADFNGQKVANIAVAIYDSQYFIDERPSFKEWYNNFRGYLGLNPDDQSFNKPSKAGEGISKIKDDLKVLGLTPKKTD